MKTGQHIDRAITALQHRVRLVNQDLGDNPMVAAASDSIKKGLQKGIDRDKETVTWLRQNRQRIESCIG